MLGAVEANPAAIVLLAAVICPVVNVPLVAERSLMVITAVACPLIADMTALGVIENPALIDVPAVVASPLIDVTGDTRDVDKTVTIAVSVSVLSAPIIVESVVMVAVGMRQPTGPSWSYTMASGLVVP